MADSKKPGNGVVPAGKSGGSMLAALRGSKAVVKPSAPGRSELLAGAVSSMSDPKLVFAMDATASREPAWAAARKTTDALFQAIPGRLRVALAVHGGSTVHTFTDFTSDPSKLRDRAASIRCIAGQTMLVPILEQVRSLDGVKVALYIGDVFEEDAADAYDLADSLRLRGCRVIILHDQSDGAHARSAQVFQELARRTGGAVLPFDASSINKLRELLEAIGALAIGGIKLLRASSKPGAVLLTFS
jgi:hypothetical protein